jgi:hypothetical protein
MLRLLLDGQDGTLGYEEEILIRDSLDTFHGSANEFVFVLERFFPSFYEFPQKWRNSIAWIYFEFRSIDRCTYYLYPQFATPDRDIVIRCTLGFWVTPYFSDLLKILRIIFRNVVFATCPPDFESYSDYLASYGILSLPSGISQKLGEYQAYLHWHGRIHYRPMFQFFHEFLVGGLDVNQVDGNGSTLLSAFISGIFRFGPTAKAMTTYNSCLRFWLKDLQDSGVNLKNFGKAQERLFKELGGPFNLRSTDIDIPHQDPSGFHRPTFFCLVRLIGFSHGPSPEDWGLWVYEPSDHFAGEFWHMIERRIEMPGGWSSDVHLFL